MAYQPETTTYDAGIYQIETTDPVDGGVGSVTNSPLLSLANRTKYLKVHVDALESGTTLIAAYATKESPALTGTPTAPTQAVGDASSKLATTAFVQSSVNGIVGVDIAGSTTTTLTQAQYSYPLIVLSGAVTAAKSVVFPAQSGWWMVMNTSTGDYTVTLKTASGAGVYIPRGYSGWIFCDGTSIYNGTNFSSTLYVAGAATLAGTLGVTGAATLSGTLAVNGATTLSSTLGVTGATTLTGAATLKNTLSVAGNTTLSGTLSVSGNTSIGGTATIANTIELGGQAGTANVPLIDFHSGATVVDYDARLQVSGGTGSAGGGTMTLIAATIAFSGAVTASSTIKAVGAVYSGDAYLNIDGNVYGTVWGGWLSNWINSAISNKQAALGFTPVQQGTGTGQLTNTVKLGWDGSRLRATVDNTDFGYFWLSAQVASSIATPGYIDFPNGLIMQWGKVTGATTGTVTFPITFPSALYSLVLQGRKNGLVEIYGAEATTSSFVWHDGGSAAESTGIFYQAIGV